MKEAQKISALTLRKQGLSYSEILKSIHVSRSTLSLWLRSIPLTKHQKQRFLNMKLDAIKKGRSVWKQTRIDRTSEIKKVAINEITKLKMSNNELLLMGAMLYWAEGAKEKEYNIGQGLLFSNQDPKMICLYLKWLQKCLKVPIDRIKFDIYVHESCANTTDRLKEYWSKYTGFSKHKFDRIYFKKHKVRTLRHNTKQAYFGLLRIQVAGSTDLNRKVSGYIDGICQTWGIV